MANTSENQQLPGKTKKKDTAISINLTEKNYSADP
jgi:hypothetical protein